MKPAFRREVLLPRLYSLPMTKGCHGILWEATKKFQKQSQLLRELAPPNKGFRQKQTTDRIILATDIYI